MLHEEAQRELATAKAIIGQKELEIDLLKKKSIIQLHFEIFNFYHFLEIGFILLSSMLSPAYSRI